MDASLLIIPQVGFLPGDDPRVLGTIAAIEDDLLRDGLLLRYRTETGVDGWPATSTRSSPARSGWSRRTPTPAAPTTRDELMERLLALCQRRRPAQRGVRRARAAGWPGNFPQAFSHLALVGAAMTLQEAPSPTTTPMAEP